jgi:preprotein translocase subunit SecD
MSTSRTVLTLVLLALLGGTVGVVLLTRDSGEPNFHVRGNPSETLQMREVLEVIQSSSPRWDSVTVTCFPRGNAPASGCLDPLAAAERSVVLLSADGGVKYRLGPALISTADVARASAGPPRGNAGWEVDIGFTPDASKRFSDITTRLVGSQIAIVVDDRVVSAPTVAGQISSGEAVITGKFTEEEARDLAERLAPPS